MVSCAQAQTLAARAPGEYDERLQIPDGGSVRVAVSVPKSYVPGTPTPLVLALHFGGDSRGAGRALLNILVRPALADLGAIIVAPDALDAGWSTPANQRAVTALLAAAAASFTVDPRRVVVTGFSMGGAGAWYWAQTHPDQFSAAIPVAGRPSDTAPEMRVPVFAVHSRADEVSPIEPTERRIRALARQGLDARLFDVDGISHYETARFVGALRQAVPWVRAVWARR